MAGLLSSASDMYRYRDIWKPGYIRLLWLADDSHRPRPRGHELVEVALDEAPPFHAVSYRWELEQGSDHVLVENKKLLATLNCKAAINHLTRCAPGNLIWIDAVCIDQNNLIEKNMQVAMMAEIYKRAQYTVVWLGEALDDHVFETNLHAGLKTDAFDNNNMLVEQRSDPNHPLHGKNSTDPDLYLGDFYQVPNTLEKILQRSWFGRIWMLQEVALAKNVIVHCANASFSWEDLAEATRRLSRAQKPSPRASFEAPLKIMGIRNNYRTNSVNMVHLLSLSRTFDATDLRDKVYGLLGLSPEFARLIGAPDYRKSVEEVWMDAAQALFSKFSIKALILTTSAIELADLPEELPQHPDDDYIPSWLLEMDTVDVRNRASLRRFFEKLPSWIPNLENPGLEWPMLSRDIDASYGSVQFSMEESCLKVKATIVDEIRSVSLGKTGGNNRQMWMAWMDWLECCGSLDRTQRSFRHPDMDSNMPLIYSTKESMELVFWKIVFCDIDDRLKDGEDLREWHNWFCLELQMNLLLMDSRLLSDRDAEEWLIGDCVIGVGRLRSSTRHKTLFQTEKIFLGLAPQGVHEGDKIVFFSGYNVPFVLRNVESSSSSSLSNHPQHPNSFRILGPCYVHGLMNGELCKWDEFDWKELVII